MSGNLGKLLNLWVKRLVTGFIRRRVKWDEAAAVTPFGQLAFFIEFLKTASLWDGWVKDSQVTYMSPNAPTKAEVLGTILLSASGGSSAGRAHQGVDSTE
jgi:hypothetical protein